MHLQMIVHRYDRFVTSTRGSDRRADLAASLAPLWRALLAMEREVTDRHGMAVWAYAALHHLNDAPVRPQAALAASLGLAKTRIIPVLDVLQDHAFIRREPDQDDRRIHVLTITAEGRRRFRAVQRDIHA